MLKNNRQSSLPTLASSMTDSGSIDWSLIQTIDPIYLRSSRGIDSMKLIAQQFLCATTVPIENQTLILKLLQVLQVIVGYLCTSQDNFAEQLKEKEIENQKLKEIIDKKSQDFIIGVQCPVCNKLFKSIFFLDKHILKSHQNMANLWQGIRMPYQINNPLFNNNILPPEQNKAITAVESEDIQKTLKEIQRELKHKHHSKEKHIQHKFENRISDVENEIVKLKSISEPLLQYQTQVQTQPQQTQLLFTQPQIPQVLVQTLPIQRSVEIEPNIPSNKNDNQTKNNTHHSHHKHKTSHKSSPPPALTEQATSPFSKQVTPNNDIDSDSYNTNSDNSIDDTKIPVKNVVQIKYENQNQNSNSNPVKEKQNTQDNNIKPDTTDIKTKKKIKKKIKPTIESNSAKTNANKNQNTNFNQQQITKNAAQNANNSVKNSQKTKLKENVQKSNPIITSNQKTPLTQNNNSIEQKHETNRAPSKPQFGIIWRSPPQPLANVALDSSDEVSDNENQSRVEIGIVKRNDYLNEKSINKPISSNTNSSMYVESEREIAIQTKKNIVVSPQNTFSTQNISDNQDEVQINIPNTRTTAPTITTRCVKSLPSQSPIAGLNSSIPSISSDLGSPYVTRTRNKSLLQEMTSESDSKPFLAFDKK